VAELRDAVVMIITVIMIIWVLATRVLALVNSTNVNDTGRD
jgi:hypothetical protein